MKLLTQRIEMEDSTGTASLLTRQSAYAGIAIIWVFNTGGAGDIKLADSLYIAILFIFLSLSFDYFQYIYKSILFGIHHRCNEKK